MNHKPLVRSNGELTYWNEEQRHLWAVFETIMNVALAAVLSSGMVGTVPSFEK